jgi:two-component system, NtrC family, sensor kinase
MKCSRCRRDNPSAAMFCSWCGAPLDATAAIGGFYAELQVENDRLRRAVAEASEQQTATAEILRVIGTSPTSTGLVFEAIARSAVRVCGALSCGVFVVDESMLHLASTHGVPAERLERFRAEFPAPLTSPHDAVRAVRDRSLFHMADIENNREASPEQVEVARLGGYRTRLMVPMVRGDIALGLIAVTRAAPTPFSERQVELLRTFADQAVIAIENVRLFKELELRNLDLTTALERQTATGEILRVISSSPTDEKPVFDAIARSSVRLCAAAFAVVASFDGELLYFVAGEHVDTEGRQALAEVYPMRPDRGQLAGRAILDRTVIHVTDVRVDPEYVGASLGNRATLSVPMLRTGAPIGTITIARFEPVAFTDQQIELLKTFADQAVIAIENVRLFTELREKNRALTQAHAQVTEALEQQTATSEILRVIASSPTDVQPVLGTIAEHAARLCSAYDAAVYLLHGDRLRLVAHHGPVPVSPRARDMLLSPESVAGRAVLDGRAVHVDDLSEAAEFPYGRDLAREVGYRTVLVVPLLREGIGIGAIGIRRIDVQPFTAKQIALLETFADQAMIAIENVRLFTEVQASNRDLKRALDQQIATSEILRTITHTPTDVQPVFDTIVRSAAHLCHGIRAAVFVTDGESLREPANYGGSPEAMAATRSRYPRPVAMDTTPGMAVLTQAVVHVPDTEDPSALAHVRQSGRIAGFRSCVTVPMVREGEAIGAILVARPEPGAFSDAEVALLQTFADQAVIAIENVRLFRELEAANRELAAASQHKSEFLANMSHELRTPLNAIIGFSEVLSERMFGEVNEKQEEYLKDIHASGQHLLSLINDILDLSKIEAGKMELEVSDFDLPMVIDNALMLVRERAARRGIELHRTVDEQLGQIQGDERKVRQVLLNLLSNAIKFTPGGGRIGVQARPVNGSVEVSVSDTGVGIAPEDQEAVFEEFRQVGTADKKVEGTGLGLALSRKFIELHGGKIWVKSQVGHGSTFTFTMPVRGGE